MTGSDAGVPAVAVRRRYRHPPIEEATCEIRFVPSDAWDPTMPGLVYGELRSEYPAKPVTQGLIEAGIKVTPDGPDGPSVLVRQDLHRVQFRSEDGRRIAAVGPDVLSVHLLRPYTSWEAFREQIRAAIGVYVKVAAPIGISRIGVRYINRIEVQASTVDLPIYFTSPPDPPSTMPQRIRSFITRVEAIYDDSEDTRVITTFASSDTTEDRADFILDIDVVTERSFKTTDLREVMAAVEDLRDRERTAFEALITDEARGLFDAVE